MMEITSSAYTVKKKNFEVVNKTDYVSVFYRENTISVYLLQDIKFHYMCKLRFLSNFLSENSLEVNRTLFFSVVRTNMACFILYVLTSIHYFCV